MNHKRKPRLNARKTRFLVFSLTILFALLCACALFLIKSKEFVFESAIDYKPLVEGKSEKAFPLGVDPSRKMIVENPQVEEYFEEHITAASSKTPRDNWFTHTLALLTQMDWYQNLASPISRILVIDSGERKEEVAHNFSRILRWDQAETETFMESVTEASPALAEGKFTPGHYVVSKDATPEEVASLLVDQFNAHVLARYPEEVAEVVPLRDALTIASLLEREAYDFEDMRYISGIIWNRLFVEMNLQLDASLQYAKANESATAWWSVPQPNDKFIDSPYNTYKNEGLPPSPIANPSDEAILAALNPKTTDCIFYFHDQDGGFHCTQTYQEHVKLLKEIYGQGR